MVASTRPPKNGFNAIARKVYNPIGFSKAYNFILFFIFAGALFGFTLARLQYLSFRGIFCAAVRKPSGGAAPGECYFYLNFTRYKVGIMLHLATILPAALLVIMQFIPVVRHKAILVHRVNGYVVLLLWVLSTAGALMIGRHAFGGGIEVQTVVGFLGIVCTVSFILAYVNIKRLQIEQHRAWMLRGWFYAGCIITSRIIQICAASIMTRTGDYYALRPCSTLNFIHKSERATMALYPVCASFFNGTNPDQEAIVHANMKGLPSEIGAALGMPFGMSLWLALAIHAIGIEVYLHLTPRETERLRNVSYQRQLEAGTKNTGSAGLTSDRLGDCAAWKAELLRPSNGTGGGSY